MRPTLIKLRGARIPLLILCIATLVLIVIVPLVMIFLVSLVKAYGLPLMEVVRISSAPAEMAGTTSGRVILRMTVICLAPAMRAHSSRVGSQRLFLPGAL